MLVGIVATCSGRSSRRDTNRPDAPMASAAGEAARALRRRRMWRARVLTLDNAAVVATGGFGSSRIWNITRLPFSPRVLPIGHIATGSRCSSRTPVSTQAFSLVRVAIATGLGFPAVAARAGRLVFVDRYSQFFAQRGQAATGVALH